MWQAHNGGATRGGPGSESGRVIFDDEYEGASRITLEEGGAVAPFAITCGVYGWMVHTRFFSDRAEAEGALVVRRAGNAVREFIARYP
jgi:hypothetical protein